MFGSKNTIKLDRDMMEKVKKYAEVAGYDSPDAFVRHALQKELDQLESADSDEDIKNKLKGLGYIS